MDDDAKMDDQEPLTTETTERREQQSGEGIVNDASQDEDDEGDSDVEEESDLIDPSVFLGFTSPLESVDLIKTVASPYLSKIGGKPFWLIPDPKYVLHQSDVYCLACENRMKKRRIIEEKVAASKLSSDPNSATSWEASEYIPRPMRLLLQLYAPFPSIENAFHRILYLFLCTDSSCSAARLFRAQLPRNNPYYEYDYVEPSMNEWLRLKDQRKALNLHLCVLCGMSANSACSKCKSVWYCGKECQREHWKSLGHKTECNQSPSTKMEELQVARGVMPLGRLFPELEIIVEPAADIEDGIQDGANANNINAMGTFQDADEEELPGDIAESSSSRNNQVDKEMLRFQQAIHQDPDQVIRYYFEEQESSHVDHDEHAKRSHQPVWPQSDKVFDNDPPACQFCGACRRLEFQVMPQIIYFIEQEQKSKTVSSVAGSNSIPFSGNDCHSVEEKQTQCESSGEAKGFENPEVGDHVEEVTETKNEMRDLYYSLATALTGAGSIDFGTIVAYTCEKSCYGSLSNQRFGESESKQTVYREEFVYVQPALACLPP